ncbi:MAG: acyl-CoA thioesterase [Lachnospiraceae bacterium]|nr:acyl-CoA thioesterase [Lachnospiraceae bacterium]
MLNPIYEHKVQYYETDKMGITHHSNYIRWMEEARVDFLSQIGWDYAKLESMGIVSPVVSVECKYKTTSTFSDIIRISVSVEEFKGVKLKLGYLMTNAESKVVCEAKSEHCFLNQRGMPMRLSKEFPALYETLTELAGEV